MQSSADGSYLSRVGNPNACRKSSCRSRTIRPSSRATVEPFHDIGRLALRRDLAACRCVDAAQFRQSHRRQFHLGRLGKVMGLRFDDVGGGQHHIRPIPLAVHAGQCELALRPSQGEPAVAVLVPPVVLVRSMRSISLAIWESEIRRSVGDGIGGSGERENTSPPVASTRSSRSKTPAEEAFRCSRMARRTFGLSGNRLSRKLRGAGLSIRRFWAGSD